MLLRLLFRTLLRVAYTNTYVGAGTYVRRHIRLIDIQKIRAIITVIHPVFFFQKTKFFMGGVNMFF